MNRKHVAAKYDRPDAVIQTGGSRATPGTGNPVRDVARGQPIEKNLQPVVHC
jgi:hypothetical protein